MKHTNEHVSRRPFAVIAIVLGLALSCFALCACGGQNGSSAAGKNTSTTGKNGSSSSASYATEATGPYASGAHIARVNVEGYGSFEIDLDANAAPVTVSHFCDEVAKGTYNGTSFHRIVEDFCLQGGDPTGTGAGTGDVSIVGEFSGNGIANALADDFHTGTVAMARMANPNSASLQWFITLSDKEKKALNGKYAAFGQIDSTGMAIVNQIVADYLPKATGSGGVIPSKADQPVITSIEIIS